MVSLSDIRTGNVAPVIPTIEVPLCLNNDLWSELDRLTSEAMQLKSDRRQKQAQGPKNEAAGISPRERDVDARIEEICQSMADDAKVLVVGAKGGLGPWIHWVDANPARSDNVLDQELAQGICNAAALVANLGKWVVSWDGEPFEDGDWDKFSQFVPAGATGRIARAVVEVHETDLIPKAPSSTSNQSA